MNIILDTPVLIKDKLEFIDGKQLSDIDDMSIKKYVSKNSRLYGYSLYITERSGINYFHYI